MPTLEAKIVPLKSITILPGRGRKTFAKIPELAESMKQNGFISVIYVTNGEQPDTYVLVAGERRYRAAVLAGIAEVPILFKDQLSPVEQKIAELEENVQRVDLEWQEQAALHAQIHELQVKKDPTWTQNKTAELTGMSKEMISRQMNIIKDIKANPEVKDLIVGKDFNTADKIIKQHKQVKDITDKLARKQITITTDLKLGSCIDEIKKLETHSVDLLLTDPPYGLDALETLREGDGSVMPGHAMLSDTHNMKLEDVLKLLKALAPELHRVLKPGAHWYCFCAIQHIGEFVKALEPLMFRPPVLIWDREKNTTLGNNGYDYLSCTETIIYGHNPPIGKRLAKSLYNVFKYPVVPRNMRVYPFEKPQGLLKQFINQSTILNDLVLDPFAGSASTLKAARQLGRRSIGFEVNEDSWKLAQVELNKKENTGE